LIKIISTRLVPRKYFSELSEGRKERRKDTEKKKNIEKNNKNHILKISMLT